MKKSFVLILALALVMTLGLFGCEKKPEPSRPAAQPSVTPAAPAPAPAAPAPAAAKPAPAPKPAKK